MTADRRPFKDEDLLEDEEMLTVFGEILFWLQTNSDAALRLIEEEEYHENMERILRKQYECAPFWTLVQETARGRRFGTTAKGEMAWFLRYAREGDVLCLFKGAATPCVLRQHEDGKPFTFVGECYVHRIMYGEALHTGALEEQTF